MAEPGGTLMFGSMAEDAEGAKEKASEEHWQGMDSEVGSKPDKGAITIPQTKVVQ